MTNKRVKQRYFIIVLLILQQCADINCNSIALPEEKSIMLMAGCGCMGCDPCTPYIPTPKPPIVPSCDCLGCDPCRPVIPPLPPQTPPATPPPTTPACVTECNPPQPPPTPPPMIIPLTPICVTTGFTSALSQLLATSCHDCSNPNCSSSPEGTSFPYPNHCQYFWKCQGGIATVCYCPNGTWFDRDRNCCNYCPNVTNCPANVN